MFVLRSSKTHGEYTDLQIIKITSQCNRSTIKLSFDPYDSLRKYLDRRKSCLSSEEAFFIFRDRSPVKPYHANAMLKKVLTKARFDPVFYSFHSLHSGRALDLLKLGLSVEMIKKLGRRKSNAMYNYLKN